MSEYIDIEIEIGDDGRHIYMYTNLKLADDGPETYASAEALEEGSPVAQTLAAIEGITQLHIEAGELIITPDPEAATHTIIADVSAALKDFFL